MHDDYSFEIKIKKEKFQRIMRLNDSIIAYIFDKIRFQRTSAIGFDSARFQVERMEEDKRHEAHTHDMRGAHTWISKGFFQFTNWRL